MKLALTIVVLAYSVVLLEAVLAAVRLAREQVDTLGLAGTADYSCRSLPTAPSLRCVR